MSVAAEAPRLIQNAFGEWQIPEYEFEAEYLGPSYRRAENGDFLLPEKTLGYEAVDWAEANLLTDEVDENGKQKPWRFTAEQFRILLWWYAVDAEGQFVYRDGIIQRLKGHGKDPLLSAICLIELLGPCRFNGWVTELDDAYPERAIGDPIVTDVPTAWVQIAAVAKKQTQNTMKFLRQMLSPELKAKYRLQVNMESIYAYGGNRHLEAVTSSPATLEGNRPTFVVRNETHHWKESNDGIELADVIERNLEKSKGGLARALSITNAYAPHENSVAQIQREAWELEEAGVNVKTGVMYDSIEAPAGTPLSPPNPPERPTGLTDDQWSDIRRDIGIAWLSAIVEKIRGDSVWVNPRRIALGILSGRRAISVSKRYWLNMVSSAEDAWVDPGAIKEAISVVAASNRDVEDDQLRAGWLPMPDEPIVIFGDGSKSDDATALVGCRLSDGYIFLIGVWQAPPKVRKNDWTVPRGEVDARVIEAFSRFNVVGFWFDPSHAKDDEDETTKSFWSSLCNIWMRRYREKLKKELWPVKSGAGAHAVTFDMAGPLNRRLFAEAAEEFVEEFHKLNDVEEFAPSFQIDGHPALVQHFRNAKQYPTADGTSLAKDGRESPRKIDIAVCAVGAYLLRKTYLNIVPEDKPVGGRVWGALGG